MNSFRESPYFGSQNNLNRYSHFSTFLDGARILLIHSMPHFLSETKIIFLSNTVGKFDSLLALLDLRFHRDAKNVWEAEQSLSHTAKIQLSLVKIKTETG